MVDFVADALVVSRARGRAVGGPGHGLRRARHRGREALGVVTKPRATVHAVDVSPDAVAVARARRRRCGVADVAGVYASARALPERLLERPARLARRVATHVGSWFEPLDALNIHGFGGIVSNPPYIPSRDATHLQPRWRGTGLGSRWTATPAPGRGAWTPSSPARRRR